MTKPLTAYTDVAKTPNSFGKVAKQTTAFSEPAKNTTAFAVPSKNPTSFADNEGVEQSWQLNSTVVTLGSLTYYLSGFTTPYAPNQINPLKPVPYTEVS